MQFNTIIARRGAAALFFTTATVMLVTSPSIAQPILLIEDCGTISPGPQSCILFTTDAGATFAVSGEIPGGLFDRVWITGTSTPGNVGCFPVEIPVLDVITAGECFNECGALQPGPQGCPILSLDNGEFVFLENVDITVFDPNVWVKGCLNPQSLICAPFTAPGVEDNRIGACFEGCGTLIQGVECVLFEADAGGTYLVANRGPFGVGDRVFVRGCVDPLCVSFCSPTNGCIIDNLIRACCDCPGDMNGDGVRAGNDIAGFVRCLVGPVPGEVCACADIDGDGAVTPADIPPFVQLLLDNAPCEPVGACCQDIDDGPLAFDHCEIATETACVAGGGVFQGAGSECGLEACCLSTGYCQETDPGCCVASGGQPLGPGSTCADTACDAVGACCSLTANITCHEFTPAECESFGGFFLGAGTVCGGHRACCMPDDSCLFIDVVCCVEIGGTPSAPNVECLGDGACCLDFDDGPLQYDTCRVIDRICCEQQGGVYQGLGTQCTVEACCLPAGGCQETDPQCCAASGGSPGGPGSTCTSVPCF